MASAQKKKKKTESVSLKTFLKKNGHLVTNWSGVNNSLTSVLLDVEFAVTITSENEISKMKIIFLWGNSFRKYKQIVIFYIILSTVQV